MKRTLENYENNSIHKKQYIKLPKASQPKCLVELQQALLKMASIHFFHVAGVFVKQEVIHHIDPLLGGHNEADTSKKNRKYLKIMKSL